MDGIVAFEKWLTRILEWILVALFFGLFVMVVLLVALRYVFNTTIIGGNEGIVVAFIYTTALGSAVAIGRREHIAITFFIENLPKVLKTGIYVSGIALIALVNAVAVWYSIGWIGKTGGYLMPALQMPQIVAQASIPIGGGLAILYCLVKIVLVLSGRESSDALWIPED